LRPSFASARYNLAIALAKAGHVDDAVDQLRRILADNPEDPAAKRRLADALTLRGVLLLRDGKRDDAVAQFEEALQLDPSNQEARKEREQALGK
jgi:tetratricopeptide (TPR) repeat protein